MFSSCSTAQNISAPFQTRQVELQEFSNVDIAEALKICSLFNTSAALGSGLWLSYTPTRDSIVQVRARFEDPISSSLLPYFQVFQGSCAALTCPSRLERHIPSNDMLLDAESGVQYYIYFYRPQRAGPSKPFSISVNEIAPPPNDNIENAVALNRTALPYRGEFTTYGALSDFDLDACALFGDAYGVWFSYTSSVSERLSLEASTGNLNNVIGIQVQNGGNGFTCIARGSSFGTTIEWIAESGVTYYILVTDPSLLVVNPFEFKLQTIGNI